MLRFNYKTIIKHKITNAYKFLLVYEDLEIKNNPLSAQILNVFETQKKSQLFTLNSVLQKNYKEDASKNYAGQSQEEKNEAIGKTDKTWAFLGIFTCFKNNRTKKKVHIQKVSERVLIAESFMVCYFRYCRYISVSSLLRLETDNQKTTKFQFFPSFEVFKFTIGTGIQQNCQCCGPEKNSKTFCVKESQIKYPV